MTSRPRSGADSRVRRLVEAARRLADPEDALGKEARATLPGSTGLSAEGVELALTRCLEVSPTDDEIAALCASVEPSPHAHVLLSANVFVAAHRAIALGLASSERVSVRASRREPEMVRLLAQGTDGLFQVVPELTPEGGEDLWAYGSDATLDVVGSRLPAGVRFHAHGSGFGVAVVDVAAGDDSLREFALSLSEDVVPFDQRGCLSPRVVFALGEEGRARRFAGELAHALAGAERRVPRGIVDAAEAADAARYRDTLRFAGDVFPAGSGWVGLAPTGFVVVPPVGRHVHVTLATKLEEMASPLRTFVAAVGVAGPAHVHQRVGVLFPGARRSVLGAMQRPPFDGPVDRRKGEQGGGASQASR